MVLYGVTVTLCVLQGPGQTRRNIFKKRIKDDCGKMTTETTFINKRTQNRSKDKKLTDSHTRDVCVEMVNIESPQTS